MKQELQHWYWLVQARAVVDGLPGDIVALALPLDIMKIEEAGLIAPGWQVHIKLRARIVPPYIRPF